MKTTYVLGAGASFDAGYPFAKDLGRELLFWMEQAKSEGIVDYAAAAISLRERFGDEEDIERLLERIEELSGRREDEDPDVRAAAVAVIYERQALREGIARWFAEIGQGVAETYRRFASEVLRPGDCVITLNYDLSLDRELKRAGIWEAGDGYGFEIEGLPRGSQVQLYKLHGSIGWIRVLFGGRWSGTVGPDASLGVRPVLLDDSVRQLGYLNEVDNRVPRSRNFAVEGRTMILPVREKQFYTETSVGIEANDFWNALWNQATEAVRLSDRIVICGYSMPLIDERACKLLLEDSGLRAEFEVCCGNDSEGVADRIRAAGRQAVVADQVLFEEWVSARSQAKKGSSGV